MERNRTHPRRRQETRAALPSKQAKTGASKASRLSSTGMRGATPSEAMAVIEGNVSERRGEDGRGKDREEQNEEVGDGREVVGRRVGTG